MKKYNIISSVLILFAISSCKPTFDEPKYDKGTADFSSYVAVGNSLTAGYADNALYADGQKNSYPAMLAKRFALVGGNNIFNLPLIDDANAERGVSPAPLPTDLFRTSCKLILGNSVSCLGTSSLGPVPYALPVSGNTSFYQSIASGGPYNNLGIPGIKSFQIDNPAVGVITSPLFNPYYARMANIAGTSSVLGDALLVNPTFFTLWLGNNDVLAYATSGGISPMPGTGATDITPLDVFNDHITLAVKKLVSTGAKGAIANIPDVTDIPFFNTVPYNALSITDQGQVDGLNAAYAGTNIVFNLGANAFVVSDTGVLGFRQIKSDELICLTVPQDSLKCGGWGSQKPIPDQYWLDKGELDQIKLYTTNYNTRIHFLADSLGLAHADMNAYFKSFAKGIAFNGVDYSPVFVSGGAFSLDGVHPNKRGYALIANQYIRAINDEYGSTIPEVDVNSYPGIVFP